MTFDVVSLLRKAASLLSDLARYTPTEIDDAALRVITAALEIKSVQDLIRSLLESPVVARLSGVARTTAILDECRLAGPECRTIVEQWGLDWRDFLRGMVFLVRWLLVLCGRR